MACYNIKLDMLYLCGLCVYQSVFSNRVLQKAAWSDKKQI